MSVIKGIPMNPSEYVPHVVIIEARTVAEHLDLLYDQTVENLETARIGHSRVTIPTLLSAPITMRTIIEATRGAALSGNNWRRPDGYLILGCFRENDLYPETTYREIVRAVQDLACYYTIPVGYALLFPEHIKDQSYRARVREGVANCVSVMELKRQMGLTPGAILTP